MNMVPPTPTELICELIGMSIRALKVLQVKIRREDIKSRYRLLDPDCKTGVESALDCYRQILAEFPIAATPTKAFFGVVEELESEWENFFDVLSEELNASPTCEDARAAHAAVHARFTSQLDSPSSEAEPGVLAALNDSLKALSEELRLSIQSRYGTVVTEELSDKQIVDAIDCATRELAGIVANVQNRGKERYMAVDPTIPPMSDVLKPLTEDFVTRYAIARGRQPKNESKLAELEEILSRMKTQVEAFCAALERNFPNAPACSCAQRTLRSMFDRVCCHCQENGNVRSNGFGNKSISAVHTELTDALSKLSDFIKSKDKPTTPSGHRRVAKGKGKPGRQYSQEQSRQITEGLRNLANAPGQWTAAARPIIEAEGMLIGTNKKKPRTDGFLAKAKNNDQHIAIDNLAAAIRRTFEKTNGKGG